MNRVSAACVLAAALCGLLFGSSPAAAQSCVHRPLQEKHFQGRVLVQPRPGLSLDDFDRILEAHGGRRVQVIKQINVHVIELPPEANAAAVAEALRKNPDIEFAEIDRAVERAISK